MCIGVWALLPGKNRRYYDEVLNFIHERVTTAPKKIMSDFKKAEIASAATAFPGVNIKCCMFHYGQSLFRNFKRLGLVPWYAQKNAHGESVRNTFRSILALPLLPPEQIRRALFLITNSAVNGLEEFFLYFSRTYIGLTQRQLTNGVNAFAPNVRRSINTTLSEHSYANQLSDVSSYTEQQEFYARISAQWPEDETRAPLVHYALSEASSSMAPSVLSRDEELIVRQAQFPIQWWNMHSQAASALARTNNGLEATHLHFMKGLNHHPALSDFIFEVNKSIDKQVDAARSARHFAHKRHKRYIIQDALIMRILTEASYEHDTDILDLLAHLGLQIEGYAAQLKNLEENFNELV